MRAFTLMLGMAIGILSNSCAPHVRVLSVKSPESDYVVKELLVTGRPTVKKDDFYPALSIEGFERPTEDPYHIDSPVGDDELVRKLDPAKTYWFHVYTTDQTLSKDSHIYHAILSDITDGKKLVIDASVCDVHHRKMDFVPATNVDWRLRSKMEQRGLDRFHNHGYAFPSCCSGGMIHWYTWRCPECAKKVDGFKSKFEP